MTGLQAARTPALVLLLCACTQNTESLTPTFPPPGLPPSSPPPVTTPPCLTSQLEWSRQSRISWNEDPASPSVDVDVRGQRAYVTTQRDIRVVDLNEFQSPELLSIFRGLSPLAKNLALAEPAVPQLAFLAVTGDGVRTIELRDDGPVELSAFDLVGAAGAEYANDLRWVDGRLYVAALAQGLWVLGLRTTDQLSVEGSCCRTTIHPLKGISDVEVVDTLAYAADTEQLLHVIDIQASPTVLSTLPLPGPARSLRANAELLLIAADEAGLLVLDRSAPRAPTSLAQLNGPGRAVRVVLEGSLAFVAALEGGVWVVDISNPNDPQLITVLPSEGEARGIDIVGDHVFVAEGQALSIFEQSCQRP